MLLTPCNNDNNTDKEKKLWYEFYTRSAIIKPTYATANALTS